MKYIKSDKLKVVNNQLYYNNILIDNKFEIVDPSTINGYRTQDVDINMITIIDKEIYLELSTQGNIIECSTDYDRDKIYVDCVNIERGSFLPIYYKVGNITLCNTIYRVNIISTADEYLDSILKDISNEFIDIKLSSSEEDKVDEEFKVDEIDEEFKVDEIDEEFKVDEIDEEFKVDEEFKIDEESKVDEEFKIDNIHHEDNIINTPYLDNANIYLYPDSIKIVSDTIAYIDYNGNRLYNINEIDCDIAFSINSNTININNDIKYIYSGTIKDIFVTSRDNLIYVLGNMNGTMYLSKNFNVNGWFILRIENKICTNYYILNLNTVPNSITVKNDICIGICKNIYNSIRLIHTIELNNNKTLCINDYFLPLDFIDNFIIGYRVKDKVILQLLIDNDEINLSEVKNSNIMNDICKITISNSIILIVLSTVGNINILNKTYTGTLSIQLDKYGYIQGVFPLNNILIKDIIITSKIELSKYKTGKHNDTILYQDKDKLYLGNIMIEEDIIEFTNNDNYIVYTKNDGLYINDDKIELNTYNISMNDEIITGISNNKVFIYELINKRITFIDELDNVNEKFRYLQRIILNGDRLLINKSKCINVLYYKNKLTSINE